jgi:hypothetical protein
MEDRGDYLLLESSCLTLWASRDLRRGTPVASEVESESRSCLPSTRFKLTCAPGMAASVTSSTIPDKAAARSADEDCPFVCPVEGIEVKEHQGECC